MPLHKSIHFRDTPYFIGYIPLVRGTKRKGEQTTEVFPLCWLTNISLSFFNRLLYHADEPQNISTAESPNIEGTSSIATMFVEAMWTKMVGNFVVFDVELYLSI